MTPTVVLPVVIGGLYAAGVYLLLDRSLTRVVLGFLLLGNATNLLLLSTGGPAGSAPIVGRAEPEEMNDPLPQALILTAIVITFGVSAFLLALAYRSWVLTQEDEVQDDVEDRRIARQKTPSAPLEVGDDDDGDGGDEPDPLARAERADDQVEAEARGVQR